MCASQFSLPVPSSASNDTMEIKAFNALLLAVLQALKNVVEMLKPGFGWLLLRDYASGDYAQQRFLASSRQQQLGDGSFVRGDGTLACYFREVRLTQHMEHASLCFVRDRCLRINRDAESANVEIRTTAGMPCAEELRSSCRSLLDHCKARRPLSLQNYAADVTMASNAGHLNLLRLCVGGNPKNALEVMLGPSD